MRAEIKFVPGEGAKSINKAIVEVRDAQGIVMDTQEIYKAQSEQEKDQLEAAIDIPVNGKVEIKTKSGYVADPEALAAVPPESQESDQVKEEKKKKGEEKKRQRDEALHEAALQRGLAYEGPPPKFPGPGNPPPAQQLPHADKKDDKLDARGNPSASVGQSPKPPMGDDKRK